ncbi:hypothetical protein TcasGA2_TC001695 [Tribolium castaneum]|uniref:Uncharacterized protein n=1 Tax=Tribolium castaneum TaxID=7070 RepID=D6W8F1_TRICA|nr:hypothetical protein TcasGA2_TC001695 [Tribolium castaneum]
MQLRNVSGMNIPQVTSPSPAGGAHRSGSHHQKRTSATSSLLLIDCLMRTADADAGTSHTCHLELRERLHQPSARCTYPTPSKCPLQDPALASRALLIKDAGRRQRRIYLYIATTPMTSTCVRALPLHPFPHLLLSASHYCSKRHSRSTGAAIDGTRRRRRVTIHAMPSCKCECEMHHRRFTTLGTEPRALTAYSLQHQLADAAQNLNQSLYYLQPQPLPQPRPSRHTDPQTHFLNTPNTHTSINLLQGNYPKCQRVTKLLNKTALKNKHLSLLPTRFWKNIYLLIFYLNDQLKKV